MWSVFFVFLSYLDRNFVKGEFLGYPLDTEKENKEISYMLNNTFCAKSSLVGDFHLHQVSDGIEEVRSLRDHAGKLVDCTVNVNEMQVKSFMHVCRLGLKVQRNALDGLVRRATDVNEAKLNCQELKSRNRKAPIAPKKTAEERETISGAAEEDQVLRRSKRGFTYPGTLWCGAGNIATHYDELGEFAETDKCCRVHDHCPYVIHAFSSSYGYTNFKWHSISHCDCDNALKDCLRQVNDTSSRVVGQAFFNVIEVPCFEFSFEEQCVERHWYGVCKKYESAPVAVMKESIPYDFGGIDVIDELTIAPPVKKEPDSNDKQGNQGKPAISGRPPVSGSQASTKEEPSLTNVVTAAEDFIKVLATVSTSQSSSADAAKGDAQGAERKKKKGSSKKKKDSKKRRGKGRGKKRKQKVDTVSKMEEGLAGATTNNQTEEEVRRTNFVEDPVKVDRSHKNSQSFLKRVSEPRGREEHSNFMMRDEQGLDEASLDISVHAPDPVKESKMLESQNQSNTTHKTTTQPHQPAENNQTHSCMSCACTEHRARRRGKRKGNGKRHPASGAPLLNETPLSDIEVEPPAISTGNTTTSAAFPTDRNTGPAEREQVHKLQIQEEKGSVFFTATPSPSFVKLLKAKRQRSKEREGRKRMRNVTAPPVGDGEAQRDAVAGAADRLAVPTAAQLRTSERLQPLTTQINGVDIYTTTSPTSGPSIARKGRQRLKDSKHRKKPEVGTTTPLSDAVDSKTDHDTTMIATTTTRTSATTSTAVTATKAATATSPGVSVSASAPGETQPKGAAVDPEETSLSALNSAPTTPLPTSRAKRRKAKGRGRKRKSKAADSAF